MGSCKRWSAVSSPIGVWGGAPATNDFSAFWTKIKASGAIILRTVCSWMTCSSRWIFSLVSWISSMVCKLPQWGLAVWGGAPAANDFGAFWTKMEASCAIILRTVGSWMTRSSRWIFSLPSWISSMVCNSPSGVWGGAPAANDFGVFWTKMGASGAIILSTVCSCMTRYPIQLRNLGTI